MSELSSTKQPRVHKFHGFRCTVLGCCKALVLSVVSTLVFAACESSSGLESVSDRAESMPVPTSNWQPGDDAATAQVKGDLRFTQDGCPYLQDGVNRWAVVWPQGYSAFNDGQGLGILNQNSEIVARDGAYLDSAGAYSNELPKEPCSVPGVQEAALIMDEVSPQ